MIAKPPHAMFGISRIDQPEKCNHGYFVRVTVNGELQTKWFPDKGCDGKARALKQAKEYRNGLVAQVAPEEMKSRVRRAVPQSGVKAVVFRTNGPRTYWEAHWNDGDGKLHRTGFSIKKLGSDEALERAIAWRKKMKRKYPKQNP